LPYTIVDAVSSASFDAAFIAHLVTLVVVVDCSSVTPFSFFITTPIVVAKGQHITLSICRRLPLHHVIVTIVAATAAATLLSG